MTTLAIRRVRVADADAPVTDIGLWPRVNALIAELDAGHARLCTVRCESAAAFAVGILALLTTGRTAVLMASDAEVDAVLTDGATGAAGAKGLAIPAAGAGSDATPRALDEAAGVWFHTSGSSGTPGTIRKRVSQLIDPPATINATFGARLAPAVVAASVPLDHSYGFLFGFMLPLLNDWPLAACQCATPGAMRAMLAQHRAIIISSPAFLGSLRELDLSLPADRIEAIFSSAAPLEPELAHWVGAHCGQAPIGIYGTTELGPVAWREWSSRGAAPLWHVVKRVELEMCREDQGERLRILTAFGDGWALGDDYVRTTADGFELRGRVDGVVKVADKRVSLNAICDALRRHPWVDDARVVQFAHAYGRLGAVVVTSGAGRRALAEQGRAAVVKVLRATLAETYEAVLIPRKWRFIERWPEDALGKVKRQFVLQALEQPA